MICLFKIHEFYDQHSIVPIPLKLANTNVNTAEVKKTRRAKSCRHNSHHKSQAQNAPQAYTPGRFRLAMFTFGGGPPLPLSLRRTAAAAEPTTLVWPDEELLTPIFTALPSCCCKSEMIL